MFGDSVRTIEERNDGVGLVLESGKTRAFDLVIGADGIHSNVRSLVFGNESQLAQYMGYYQVSFWIDYATKPGTNVAFTEPGKFVSLFGFPNDRAMVYAVFKQPEKLSVNPRDVDAQKRLFADVFGSLRWTQMPDILRQTTSADDFLFDAASLIHIDSWAKGRTVLVGDAGYPTPLTAWGVSLGLIGAYILAGELKAANGNYQAAFASYERKFRPFVERKTKEARRTGLQLVPASAMTLRIRNQVLKLLSLPLLSTLIARMTYGRMFRESFALKDYA